MCRPSRRIISRAAVMLAGCLATAPATAATLTATITGIRNSAGHIRLAICTKADFLRPHCPYTAAAAAAPGTVTLTIQNIPPGTYAAEAFHDENDNHTIDRTFFGLPKEGMGFSNNAKMQFGPPHFDDAAFPLTTAPAQITFAIRYM
jgi:uncharacterized protein (DUF2141 family)